MPTVIVWSFWSIIWAGFVIVVSALMLMLAFWFLERRPLGFTRAFLIILGLSIIRFLFGPMMALIPFNFLWWWLFTAVYFHFTLPGPMPTWRSAVLSLLQQLYMYLLSLIIMGLGLVTSADPSAIPARPNLRTIPREPTSSVPSAANPTGGTPNPTSVMMKPAVDAQPPEVAVTLSGLARTLDPKSPLADTGTSPVVPSSPIPPPAATLPGPDPQPLGNSTLPAPEVRTINVPAPDAPSGDIEVYQRQ